MLAVLTALLVWLTGLKILDQPRFSHTRGHAYAVRTLDTLYDVSTGAGTLCRLQRRRAVVPRTPSLAQPKQPDAACL